MEENRLESKSGEKNALKMGSEVKESRTEEEGARGAGVAVVL